MCEHLLNYFAMLVARLGLDYAHVTNTYAKSRVEPWRLDPPNITFGNATNHDKRERAACIRQLSHAFKALHNHTIDKGPPSLAFSCAVHLPSLRNRALQWLRNP